MGHEEMVHNRGLGRSWSRQRSPRANARGRVECLCLVGRAVRQPAEGKGIGDELHIRARSCGPPDVRKGVDFYLSKSCGVGRMI